MYVFVFGLLMLVALIEYRTRSTQVWKLSYILLLVMAMFRYGQGTDYFGYNFNYVNQDEHSEIGYLLLCKLLRSAHIPFYGLIIIISIFDFYCIYKMLNKLCKYKALSLCMIYPTIYLVYVYSALRQGMVICFFCGFLLPWIIEKKYINYYACAILLCMFHSSALLLLILPIVINISVKSLLEIAIISSGMGAVLFVLPASVLSFVNIASFQVYLNQKSLSIIGIAERVFMLLFLIKLFLIVKENQQDNTFEIMLKIYVIGFSISMFFLPWGTISSRLGAPFKATEIVFIPLALYEIETNSLRSEGRCLTNGNCTNLYRIILILYLCVMTIKNINMNIAQGEYNCNIVTYPYISIFNKEDLLDVRNNITYLEMIEEYEQ